MADDDPKRATLNKLALLRTRAVDDWELSSLLAMMRDADPGVRDWATFALAARDDDSQEVRQALLERAGDSDFDAKSEALWGLARRRDTRALPLLVASLEGDQIGILFIEAAAYFARSELLPALEGLRDWWDLDTALLEEALARCKGLSVPGGKTWDLVPANDRTSPQS
ncbi:MAG: HEAT repeat domain-containing protein [Sphingomonas sp.]|nr:HEAT repeat domain-containing protein [Sphingomonas sp.]